MAYVPRSSADILRDLIAGVVARSELTDIADGSVLSQVLSVVALEMSSAEFRMSRIRDSFFLEAVTGGDLDDRVAELPPSGLNRLPPTAASGGALRITREAAGAGVAFTLPRGSMFGRIDDPSLVYSTLAVAEFDVGVEVANNVDVVCTTVGEAGNCSIGTITTIVSAPPSILAVEQLAPTVGGQPIETDNQLRSRARTYLSSLSRCQPTAIEYAVRTFIASDNTRVRYASLYEDPLRRGYSEIVVDDGSAFQGIDRAGRVVDGIVPRGGITILSHETPAIAPIMQIRRFENVNNAWVELDKVLPNAFVSIPERGIIYIIDPDAFEPGDKWEVSLQPREGAPDSQYRVYGGALIPEIQQMIEGDLDDPTQSPGLRAAGTRVRVVPPTVTEIQLDIHVVPVNGVDFTDVTSAVEDATIEFIGNLKPGEALIVAKLIDRLMNNIDLQNIHLYEGGIDPAMLLSDTQTLTARHVLRTTPDKVRIIPPVEI